MALLSLLRCFFSPLSESIRWSFPADLPSVTGKLTQRGGWLREGQGLIDPAWMVFVIIFWQTRQKHFGGFAGGSAPGGSASLPAARDSKERMARSSQASAEAGTCLLAKNFTHMDVKRVVNLLDSDLQGLEETFHHHPSLCFLFLEMHKNECSVLPETLSVYLCSLDILGKEAGKKKSQARGAD